MRLQHFSVQLHTLLIYALLLSFNLLSAQQPKGGDAIGLFQAELKTVEAQKKTYRQVLDRVAGSSHTAKLTTTEIDSKGREKIRVYQFDLSDLSSNSVRFLSKKDLLVATIYTKDKAKLIRSFKDGEPTNFENSIPLFAQNADNADALKSHFKQAITEAKKSEKIYKKLTSLQEGVQLLVEEDRPEEKIGAETIKIQWEQEAGKSCVLRLLRDRTDEEKGKSKNLSYRLNLGDLQPKIKLGSDKKLLFLEIQTRGGKKYIEERESGNLNGYNNKVRLYTADLEYARRLRNNFLQLIDLAKEAGCAEVPGSPSSEESMSGLNTRIGEVNWGEESVQQTATFEGVVLSLKQSFYDKKGEEKKSIDKVNLKDLNSGSVSIKVKKTMLYVAAETNKKVKFVQRTDGDKDAQYTNDVRVFAKDIDDARHIAHLLKSAIRNARGVAACQKDFAWIKSKVKNFEAEKKSFNQSIELMDNDPCKIRFTTEETGSKSTKERVYELRATDLDSRKMDFNISKKELLLSIGTKDNDKLIKVFDDGEPDDYENAIEILFEDIETARCALNTWKTIADGCKN